MNDPNTEEIKQAILEKVKLHQMVRLDSHVWEHLKVKQFVDIMVDQIILSFQIALAGETLLKQEWRYPASWWQHLKERWFPRWAKRRWPVQYETIRIDAKAVYPKISMPPSEPYQLVVQWSGDGTWKNNGPG